MKNMRPIRRAQRQQRKLELPKKSQPRCVFCIEMDHTAGQHHDSLLKFPVCQRHHDVLTELRRDAEISMRHEPDPKKRVALALRSTSMFLLMLGDAMWRWADWLDEDPRAGKRGHIPSRPHKRAAQRKKGWPTGKVGSLRTHNRHRNNHRH